MTDVLTSLSCLSKDMIASAASSKTLGSPSGWRRERTVTIRLRYWNKVWIAINSQAIGKLNVNLQHRLEWECCNQKELNHSVRSIIYQRVYIKKRMIILYWTRALIRTHTPCTLHSTCIVQLNINNWTYAADDPYEASCAHEQKANAFA